VTKKQRIWIAARPFIFFGKSKQKISSSSSGGVDRWTQIVDLYVQSVVYHSEYRTIRIQ